MYFITCLLHWNGTTASAYHCDSCASCYHRDNNLCIKSVSFLAEVIMKYNFWKYFLIMCHLITNVKQPLCHQWYLSACQMFLWFISLRQDMFEARLEMVYRDRNRPQWFKQCINFITVTRTNFLQVNIGSQAFGICLRKHLFKWIWVLDTCYFCMSLVDG